MAIAQVLDGRRSVCQGIALADDGRHRARLDEPGQEPEVLRALGRHDAHEPLADKHGQQRRAERAFKTARQPPSAFPADDRERSLRHQGPPQQRQRTVAGGVDDDVVAPPPVGDAVPGVVDDLVRADRPDEVGLRRAAHTGDVRPECLGELDGVRDDTAGRADDQHALPGWTLPTSRRAWRAVTGDWDGGRLLEAEVCGFRASPACAHAYSAKAPSPVPNTSSPARNRRRRPTASTWPATARPRMRVFGRSPNPRRTGRYGRPVIRCQTPWSTPAARTRISTSSSPGTGAFGRRAGPARRRSRTRPERSPSWCFSFEVRVLENIDERHSEDVGDLERQLQRRRVATLLDGDDGLPRHADTPASSAWVISP